MNFLTTLLAHIGFALQNAKLLQQAKDSATRLQQAYDQQGQQLDQARQQVIYSPTNSLPSVNLSPGWLTN